MYQLDIVIKVKEEKDVERIKSILQQKVERWLEPKEECHVVMITDLGWPERNKIGEEKIEEENN